MEPLSQRRLPICHSVKEFSMATSARGLLSALALTATLACGAPVKKSSFRPRSASVT